MLCRELVALKRIGPVRGSSKFSLVLCPEEEGEVDYSVYVMSDSYMGLDQQYTLPLTVQPAPQGEIFYSDEE